MTKKGLFGVKSGSKMAKNPKKNLKESKKKETFISSFCKRMFRSHIHFHSFQKIVLFSAFISVLCKRTFRSLRSFPFYAKNALFSAFISVR